jgi:outer membrane biosynthesis protein TonB
MEIELNTTEPEKTILKIEEFISQNDIPIHIFIQNKKNETMYSFSGGGAGEAATTESNPEIEGPYKYFYSFFELFKKKQQDEKEIQEKHVEEDQSIFTQLFSSSNSDQKASTPATSTNAPAPIAPKTTPTTTPTTTTNAPLPIQPPQEPQQPPPPNPSLKVPEPEAPKPPEEIIKPTPKIATKILIQLNQGNLQNKQLFTPFRISNAENVSPLSLKTPSEVGVSNDKWCKGTKLYFLEKRNGKKTVWI